MSHNILFEIAAIIAFAKIGGELCERYLRQPAVLAEIVVGVILGGSLLGWVNGKDETLRNIAEIGAVLLLFEVGLESDIEELLRVGREAIWVAIAGVIAPMFLGYGVAVALGQPVLHAIFIGAALTATSVGITARVFSDLGTLQSKESKIVLGAAVTDDVVGLIILAAVTGLVASGGFSWSAVGKATALALIFVVGAVVIGLKSTPFLLRWARAMRTRAAVSSAAVVVCLILASVAALAGLAPIVGSFAAGLVLAKTENKIHFEEKVHSIADLFVPVFFVMMGAQMDLSSIGPSVLVIGGLLFVVAIVGKLIGGLTLPAKGVHRWTIAVGMIPRGEVGLIFASIGISRGIINQEIYAAIVFVVIATTFVTPPLLKLVTPKPLDLPPVAIP